MDIKYQNRERLYTIEDLENLLEYVPYEIWLKDKEGRHVYINQKGAKIERLTNRMLRFRKRKDLKMVKYCTI